MLLLLALVAGGSVILALLLLARASEARAWRTSLTAYRLTTPAKLTTDDVSRWLGMVAAGTQGRAWAFSPEPPLQLEVVATAQGIAHYVLVSPANEARLLSTIRVGLPGARLDAAPEFLAQPFMPTVAGEVAMTSRTRPLATERADATSAALLSSLQPLRAGEEIRLSLAFTSAGTPAPVHSASPNLNDRWWATYLVEGDVSPDADAVRAARTKHRDALLQAVIRIGVQAEHQPRANTLFGRSWSAIHNLNASGVRLIRRWLPSGLIAERMRDRRLPLTIYPLLLNTRELAGLLAFPVGGLTLPGLARGASRQLPPPAGTPTHGTVLADSNFPGLEQPIALTRRDRSRHTYVLGPTGTGKSVLLANMALQDIARGDGLVLIDPKADLVNDVLARIPEHRRDDVVVLDPAATTHPVGFNLLGSLRTEAERERAVDHVVHIMASLWRESWGPRSSDTVRNGLLTLASTTAPDGSPFTLVELPELFQHKAFRRYVTSQPTVPAVLRPFWFAFEQMSDGERASVIAAPLNKLRAFSTRSSLRLMLGQSDGFDVADVFTKRRILLAKLSKGVVGTETARLFGSILIASVWSAALARSTVPPAQRRPVGVFVDEFQDTLRVPQDLADFLAQARSLEAGLTLAHQYQGQLPDSVASAVLGTARTSVVFQLDYDDAATMQRRYGPLTADDLMGLKAFEVAVRLSVNGHTQSPITGTTRPLSAPLTDAAALAEHSRQRFGAPRNQVEEALRTRLTPPGTSTAGKAVYGRKTEGPTA